MPVEMPGHAFLWYVCYGADGVIVFWVVKTDAGVQVSIRRKMLASRYGHQDETAEIIDDISCLPIGG